ncbi:RTA1 like protein, partial [Pholiota conissans]
PYQYFPSKSAAITFIVFYGVSTLLHLGQAAYYHMWWLIPTACLCGLLEVIGWSGRLWSAFSPPLSSPFEMQITATIIAPTPLLAANFVIFGAIIQLLGTQYSRLSPKWYTILFCTCDVISLVVQAVGGGKAATAAGTGEDPTPRKIRMAYSFNSQGGNIMLGGIAFQLLVITIYALCAMEFYVRYARDWPVRKSPINKENEAIPQPMTNKISWMTAALVFSTTCLFIRAVYRTIELSDGWGGRIIGTEVYFNALDGAMITLAMYTINILHPGLLLGRGMGVEKEKTHPIPSSGVNSIREKNNNVDDNSTQP